MAKIVLGEISQVHDKIYNQEHHEVGKTLSSPTKSCLEDTDWEHAHLLKNGQEHLVLTNQCVL